MYPIPETVPEAVAPEQIKTPSGSLSRWLPKIVLGVKAVLRLAFDSQGICTYALYMYIYNIQVCTYVYTHVHKSIYIYTWREREGQPF